jgi:hypothetical protein
MPRKIRQLKADLRKAGFYERTDLGKGSHTRWFHSASPEITVTLSGADGDDAKDYQESAARRIRDEEAKGG